MMLLKSSNIILVFTLLSLNLTYANTLGEKDVETLESGLEMPLGNSLPTSQDLGVKERTTIVVESEQEEVVSGDVIESGAFTESQKPTVIKEPVTSLTQNLEVGEREAVKKKKRVQISARYLGLLSQAGIDFGIWNQISLGLYYGRYQGTISGNEDAGIIPDLHHLNLQTTIYLNSERQAFQSGAQLRFGLHANQQKDSELVSRIEVDGREVIRPGQTRYGALIGAGYGWYGQRFSFNLGAEYLSLGALKTLIPLVVSLGVTF